MLASKKWFVLYTMPNQERKVADELSKKSIEVFLPLIETIRQWSDRKKMILVPMFPNYVFINALKIEGMRLFETPGIIRYLSTNGKPDSVCPEDIQLIKDILDNNPEVLGDNLQKGTRVKVISGPFEGIEGEIETSNSSCRISIRIDSLNRCVRFDISKNCVEPLDSWNTDQY